MEIKEGDIFVTNLERGFYGAFRILKKGFFDFSDYSFYLIAITQYLGKKKPELTNEKLLLPLIQKRFSCNNKAHINIYSGEKISKYFEYLGNVKINKNEKKLSLIVGDGTDGGFPLCGPVEKDFGYQTFLEWRWENEREKFEEEIRKRDIKVKQNAKEKRKKGMKPKKMIEESSFWEIIHKIDWTKSDDSERMLPAIKCLSKKSVKEIKQFQEALTYKLYQLDTKKNAENIGEYSYSDSSTKFSTDYFLYVRCCVIANGEKLFHSVLKNPKKMPKDFDFEPLLYLPQEAYEMRMKKEFEYQTGCSFETFSNYKGWE